MRGAGKLAAEVREKEVESVRGMPIPAFTHAVGDVLIASEG
jgi:hypothetical protein